jgi:hypothetical protein
MARNESPLAGDLDAEEFYRDHSLNELPGEDRPLTSVAELALPDVTQSEAAAFLSALTDADERSATDTEGEP